MDPDDTFFDMKMKLMNKSSKQFYLKTDKKIACPRIVFEYTDTVSWRIKHYILAYCSC